MFNCDDQKNTLTYLFTYRSCDTQTAVATISLSFDFLSI